MSRVWFVFGAAELDFWATATEDKPSLSLVLVYVIKPGGPLCVNSNSIASNSLGYKSQNTERFVVGIL